MIRDITWWTADVHQVAAPIPLPADLREVPGERLDVVRGDRAAQDHAELREGGRLAGAPPRQEACPRYLAPPRRRRMTSAIEPSSTLWPSDSISFAAFCRGLQARSGDLEPLDQCLVENADVKPAALVRQLLHVRPQRCGCDVRVPRGGAVNGIEKPRRVPNGPRDAELDGHPGRCCRRRAAPRRFAAGSASGRPGRCWRPVSGSNRRRRWRAPSGRFRPRPPPPSRRWSRRGSGTCPRGSWSRPRPSAPSWRRCPVPACSSCRT